MNGSDDSSDELKIPALERLGALASLLAHDLANHLSVISGNAQFAQFVVNDPERVGAALKSVLQAATLSGNLLARSGEWRRKIARELIPGEVAEIVNWLRRFGDARPKWSLDVPPELSGLVALPAHWVAFATLESIREISAVEGRIRLERITSASVTEKMPHLAARAPNRHFLELTLCSPSDKPLSFVQIKSDYANLPLLAACELIALVGGAFDSRSIPSGTQEIVFRIPFVKDA